MKGTLVGYRDTRSTYRVLRGTRVTVYRDIRFNEQLNILILTSQDHRIQGGPTQDDEPAEVVIPITKPGAAIPREIIIEVPRYTPTEDESDNNEYGGAAALEPAHEESFSSDDNNAPLPPAQAFDSRIIDGKRTRKPVTKRPQGYHAKTDFEQFNLSSTFYMSHNVPRSTKSVLDHDKWKEAMKREMESILENNTWEVFPDKGQRMVKSRWVYSRKRDGAYKARLVALGFSQRPGFDYNKTFAPVAKMQTFRTLLAFVALHKLELHAMDVVTAFLNGKLNEGNFLEPTELKWQWKVPELAQQLLRNAGV